MHEYLQDNDKSQYIFDRQKPCFHYRRCWAEEIRANNSRIWFQLHQTSHCQWAKRPRSFYWWRWNISNFWISIFLPILSSRKVWVSIFTNPWPFRWVRFFSLLQNSFECVPLFKKISRCPCWTLCFCVIIVKMCWTQQKYNTIGLDDPCLPVPTSTSWENCNTM